MVTNVDTKMSARAEQPVHENPVGGFPAVGRRTASRRVRGFVRLVIERVSVRYQRWAVAHPRWAGLYYLLNGGFDREFRAVLSGKLAHDLNGDSRAGDAARFTLRRNTHRLEKGLIMRPRRGVFAADYIRSTVEAYARVADLANSDSGPPASDVALLRWATDVLDTYFVVVACDPKIDYWKREYSRWRTNRPPELSVSGESWVPRARGVAPLPVAFDDMLALAMRRRSVRWFLAEPVPRELMRSAMRIALLSPSACNRQPFIFRFIDDPELVKNVCVLPPGTKGYGDGVPAVTVIVGRQRAYVSERDRHLIYIDGALAAMSFMYALETLGLASCPINWPDIAEIESRMSKLLDLDPDERPIMLIAFGFADPAGGVPYSAKKTVEEVCRFN